ncbi:MAG TPA: molybdenum cofactor guanylyltransferase [Flavisolibacter sp.]|nr:molybdenum cofactor guanylyltransferase [Flavisolibacter sp.]
MTGVVLCGGSSTRMGTDKGLLKEEEQTWAEIAASKLTALDLPVVVSVNDQQAPVYEQIFSNEQLLVDKEIFDAKAPLFGLLSVHLQLPEEDLFVLACDIKDMTTALLQNLFDVFKKGTQEACVYRTGERPQPLCGIYTAAALHKIYRLYQERKLQRFSMMHILETLHTAYISVGDENLAAFNNYNEPHAL